MAGIRGDANSAPRKQAVSTKRECIPTRRRGGFWAGEGGFGAAWRVLGEGVCRISGAADRVCRFPGLKIETWGPRRLWARGFDRLTVRRRFRGTPRSEEHTSELQSLRHLV